MGGTGSKSAGDLKAIAAAAVPFNPPLGPANPSNPVWASTSLPVLDLRLS